MIAMELQSIKINDTGANQYIQLVEKGGERTLTIVIGYAEVQAIDRFVKDVKMQRPMTHDLLVGLLDAAGAEMDRVEVTELKEGTYYAVIHVKRVDGTMSEVDARPSDAIALATALKKPIFVDEDVLREATAL